MERTRRGIIPKKCRFTSKKCRLDIKVQIQLSKMQIESANSLSRVQIHYLECKFIVGVQIQSAD